MMRLPARAPGLIPALVLVFPAWVAPAAAGRIEPYDFETDAGEIVAAELGTFSVPLNRGSSSDARIELKFVRFPSTNPEPGAPIVYLAGGPGGSGINAARGRRFALFQRLRAVADVIAFDQRGTGISYKPEEEECEVERPRPPGRPLDHETLIALSLDALEECGRTWRLHGIDPDAFDTLESVADLEALRGVLGAEKLSLWGISYGTHLALATIRAHTDRVHRAVLAGVEGPDHTVKLPGQFERQLDNLEAMIAADPEAAERFGNLRGKMAVVLAGLEANPVTLEYVAPEAASGARVVVGRPELERLTLSMLRDPTTLVAVPGLYERIAAGNFADLRTPSTVRFEMEVMAEGMDAASGMSAARRKRFEEEAKATLLGGGRELANALAAGPLEVTDLGDEFRAPVVSSVPALFISGTLDGRTPVSNAEETLAGFSNGVHLVIDNAGHSNDLLLSTPEILERMHDFLAGRPVSDRRLRIEPPSFGAVRERESVPPDVVRRYLGEYRRSDDQVWRVIPTGLYRTLDSEGRLLQEELEIQVRFGGNGYTLTPVAADTFYIPLPWLESIDFRFVADSEGKVDRIEFVDSDGELRRLPRIEPRDGR